MTRQTAAMLALLYCVGIAHADGMSAPKRPLTVADSIEATRLLYEDYGKALQISPNGERYLIVLYTGDIARNGNWVEFFTGSTQSLQAAAAGRVAARLFTTDFEITRFLETPVWLADSERVAFTWNDGKQPGQVMVLNLRTHRLEKLTHATRNVMEFDISPDGNHVLYTIADRPAEFVPRFGAHAMPRFEQMMREGFAVAPAADLTALLTGYPDTRSQGWFSYKLLVAHRGRRADRAIDIDGFGPPPLKPVVSPNGRWAVATAPAASIPDHWTGYDEPYLQRYIALKRRDPEALGQVRQLWLIDMNTAVARPLWDVPYAQPPLIAWSADSERLTIRNTALPFGRADFARAVEAVELEVATGRFEQVAAPTTAANAAGLRDSVSGPPGVRIEVREDENTPPALVALDSAKGAEQVILDWNARLRAAFTLGRVELVSWKDAANRAWSGRLYYPVAVTPDRRFPLVILTAPRAVTGPRQFSLRGPELIACTVSIAQPLANRNIAALVMSQPDDLKQARMGTPDEGPTVMAGYESAIEHLVSAGLVARDQVGLAGFSRAGFYVQYAITHSQFPFRAAAAADNVNESYLQYVIGDALVRNEFERVNGATPDGEGLRLWLERAPGFNAHRIRMPLRLETSSAGLISLLSHWEVFSHLQRLGKPVELYVIPDIERGSHGLVLPSQQLASLGASVDWMDFWLTGHEDRDPKKAAQYARWRKLRLLLPDG